MSQRTEQVSSLIHQKLGELIVRDIEFPEGAIATISRVEVNPDLKHAKVYVSVFPFSKSNQVLNVIKKQRGHLQQELNKALTMKFSPKLHFVVDNTTEYASQIEEELNNSLSS